VYFRQMRYGLFVSSPLSLSFCLSVGYLMALRVRPVFPDSHGASRQCAWLNGDGDRLVFSSHAGICLR
jgi:hypothetical protein